MKIFLPKRRKSENWSAKRLRKGACDQPWMFKPYHFATTDVMTSNARYQLNPMRDHVSHTLRSICMTATSFVISRCHFLSIEVWPRGLMDKASDFGSEDCRFKSCRGRVIEHWTVDEMYMFYNETDIALYKTGKLRAFNREILFFIDNNMTMTVI